jgi:hypothetical protein
MSERIFGDVDQQFVSSSRHPGGVGVTDTRSIDDGAADSRTVEYVAPATAIGASTTQTSR